MNSKNVLKKTISLAIAAVVLGSAYGAKLEDTVNKAVLTNPDVLAKWHQFKVSGSERDVSWGRYLPTLDYVYGVGRVTDWNPTPGYAQKLKYDLEDSRATLRWNVFEGLAVVNDVARLEHAQLVRYYEFLDTSESVALEAARAYVDVFRYRQLLEMAQDNYATHRLMYEKINDRVKSGVGRGVDLEVASARLALAESNLLTEASNLHDVTVRYQRIVGETPVGEVSAPATAAWAKLMPASRNGAVEAAFKNSPQLKAAIENILSAQRNVPVQRAGYLPRVDFYAEQARTNTPDTTSSSGKLYGVDKTDTVGMTVSWNLFRGFQDSSRTEKALQETFVAKDTREKVCRDLRQNVAIAHNDYMRLRDQLPFLDQHQLSTDKAREALRRQFDIGQRTLLDVLDTENEYYTARRNYMNGEMDMAVAVLRYLGGAGTLLDALKLKRLALDPPKAPDTPLDADAVNQCPAVAAAYPDLDKEAVFNRAKAKEDLLRSSAVPSNQPVSLPPAVVSPAPAPAVKPAVVIAPAKPASVTPDKKPKTPAATESKTPAAAKKPVPSAAATPPAPVVMTPESSKIDSRAAPANSANWPAWLVPATK